MDLFNFQNEGHLRYFLLHHVRCRLNHKNIVRVTVKFHLYMDSDKSFFSHLQQLQVIHMASKDHGDYNFLASIPKSLSNRGKLLLGEAGRSEPGAAETESILSLRGGLRLSTRDGHIT